MKTHKISLQSKLCKSTTSNTKKKDEKETHKKIVDPMKFENYHDFQNPIKYIKPHQVLAINRGENLKVSS